MCLCDDVHNRASWRHFTAADVEVWAQFGVLRRYDIHRIAWHCVKLRDYQRRCHHLSLKQPPIDSFHVADRAESNRLLHYAPTDRDQ